MDDYAMLHNYHIDGATTHMTSFRGRVVTITECYDSGYKIIEDNGIWNWTDQMFSMENNLITMSRLESKKGQ